MSQPDDGAAGRSDGGPLVAPGATAVPGTQDGRPPRSGLILGVLILGAVVANINLGIANVALPSIGAGLKTTQAQLNLVALGFTLGLAASVLYLGALADRYGRKLAMLAGATLSIPAACLAAWAPDPQVLVTARIVGGVAAGMLYPTTLSLISALFAGGARTRAIALWSGIGGGVSALGPLIGGLLLGRAWWGSVFLVTIPLAVLVVITGALWIPRHAGETTARVDNPGGALSVVFVGPLVLGIGLVPDYGWNGVVLGLFAVSAVSLLSFILREYRAADPLFDLQVLKIRTFSIVLTGGTIIWGGLLASLFVGQQYTQNVLGYSPLKAAAATLPAAFGVMLAARPSARLIDRHGARVPLALGLGLTTMAFFSMALFFGTNTSGAVVVVIYAVLGIGIGLAGPPSSNALMGSVPVARAGMGSASNDLQRDFGGAVFQAVMGTLLAVRYTNYFTKAFAQETPQQAQQLSKQAADTVSQSFTGAEQVAKQFPQAQSSQLVHAAKEAFVHGKTAALTFATLAAAIGFVVVVTLFPKKDDELEIYADVAAGRQLVPAGGSQRVEPGPTTTSD
jgi:EmrB/QacA subfamily drug resistance transporter